MGVKNDKSEANDGKADNEEISGGEEMGQVMALIEESLERGFPGGQLLVEYRGEIVCDLAFGSTQLVDITIDSESLFSKMAVIRGEPVTKETRFDIASLTKIFATTYLFQYYYQQDPALLERHVASFFPHDQWRYSAIVGSIPLKALLSHHAGFEPNPLFYDPHYSEALYSQDRSQFAEKLLQAPLINKPESVGLYSDVDFMLLTFILEKIGGRSIEAQLEDLFWKPLGLTHIGFNPRAKGISPQEIAATERYGNSRDHTFDFPNMRRYMLQGEVQDEKAFHCMAGVSGHAGLFSNSDDLYRLFQLMQEENAIFSYQTQQYFLTPPYQDLTFALGYRLNGPDMGYMFGDYAGKGEKPAFGHTGWTGALSTYDPKEKLMIIYLTNRKNTPVIDPGCNPHLFYGDRLPAGQYRNMIKAIYTDLGITG